MFTEHCSGRHYSLIPTYRIQLCIGKRADFPRYLLPSYLLQKFVPISPTNRGKMQARLCRLGQTALKSLGTDCPAVMSCAAPRHALVQLPNAAHQYARLHTGRASGAAHDNGFGEWDKKQKVKKESSSFSP
jgi:hypothetical protein